MSAMSIALLGLFAAFDARSASSADVTAIEVAFTTRVGEGASGLKRFFRDGCYQIESEGGAGGGKARDSQAGCHRPSDVSLTFDQIDTATSGGAVVRLGASGAAGEADDAGARPSQIHVIVVRADGSRWVAANQDAALNLVSALNGLPSESQWYAKPPDKPIGKGPQLLALSVSTANHDGPRRLEASLVADGRWWCHLSVGARSGDQPKLGKKPASISSVESNARLGRILRGARPKNAADDDFGNDDSGPVQTSIQVILGARPRGRVYPNSLAKTVVNRFAAEMRRQSPACTVP